ncbi:CD225/dispanin family protein [Myceligenerans indicum]|uniref:CD225/dispanin family protein n=1 Tax=Myceligenerans indicum TaxID=2593663 RepID=A0ABS1LQ91_9MICO|nr:CD225/dispanin family protein [Myceligenerans indicum]MBL0888208.1 CD225/dispanin family protein [Myceligenerans indicum]
MQSLHPDVHGLPLVKPASRFGLAIAVTVLFSMLFGIIAIVFACQVDAKWRRGDVEGARSASRQALGWSLVGIGFTVMTVVAVVVLAALGALGEPAGY